MARNTITIDAAELDKRIEFVRVCIEETASGYIESQAPEPVRSCWAGFKRNSVKETFTHSGDFKAEHVRFIIRGSGADLDRQMCVRYRGNLYEIEYINNYNDGGQYTEIGAKLLTLGG